jgi:hypothetical protein
VSTRVNAVSNDDASLCEPVAASDAAHADLADATPSADGADATEADDETDEHAPAQLSLL